MTDRPDISTRLAAQLAVVRAWIGAAGDAPAATSSAGPVAASRAEQAAAPVPTSGAAGGVILNPAFAVAGPRVAGPTVAGPGVARPAVADLAVADPSADAIVDPARALPEASQTASPWAGWGPVVLPAPRSAPPPSSSPRATADLPSRGEAAAPVAHASPARASTATQAPSLGAAPSAPSRAVPAPPAAPRAAAVAHVTPSAVIPASPPAIPPAIPVPPPIPLPSAPRAASPAPVSRPAEARAVVRPAPFADRPELPSPWPSEPDEPDSDLLDELEDALADRLTQAAIALGVDLP